MLKQAWFLSLLFLYMEGSHKVIALKCYQCSSKDSPYALTLDDKCGATQKMDKNVPLIDCNSNDAGSPGQFCYFKKTSAPGIDGWKAIERGCRSIPEYGPNTCRTELTAEGTQIEFCSCMSDACNFATKSFKTSSHNHCYLILFFIVIYGLASILAYI